MRRMYKINNEESSLRFISKLFAPRFHHATTTHLRQPPPAYPSPPANHPKPATQHSLVTHPQPKPNPAYPQLPQITPDPRSNKALSPIPIPNPNPAPRTPDPRTSLETRDPPPHRTNLAPPHTYRSAPCLEAARQGQSVCAGFCQEEDCGVVEDGGVEGVGFVGEVFEVSDPCGDLDGSGGGSVGEA